MGETRTRKQAEPADDWMSLPDAASELGETRYSVLSRSLKGELDTQTVADRVFVSRSSVERLKKQKESAATT